MRTIGMLAAMIFAAGQLLAPAVAVAEKTGSNEKPRQNKYAIHSANQFIGLEVVDRQGEKIGEIQDVLLDLDRGRIAYAVVSAGGLLGIGDANYIIPWRALATRDEEPRVTLKMGKEQLAEAPKRKAETGDDDYLRELHRFFGVSPYWEDRAATSGRGGSEDRPVHPR